VSKFSAVYRETLNNFQNNPISDHELQRAKNDLLASVLFDSEKTSALTDIWLSEVMEGSKFQDFPSLIKSINDVTIDSATRWVNDFIQAPSKIVVTSKEPVERSMVADLF
jgi:predicted Zn-dependent peptidase